MNQTKNFSGLVSLMLAVLIGALPFAAPEACAQALREGLTLCSGPLLLSLYPFLVVSALLIQCPLGDVLALPFRPVAWLVGVYAPCAARVLLVGFLGGFAPAANASAEAVRSGQMTPEEADRLLPACVCSGPSFVILTVGQTLLGSTEVGVLLFLAQIRNIFFLLPPLLSLFADMSAILKDLSFHFFPINFSALKNTPKYNPHSAKFHPAPCHSPLSSQTTNILKHHRRTLTRLPPSGI